MPKKYQDEAGNFVHRCAVCNKYLEVKANFAFKDGKLSNRCHNCIEKKHRSYTDNGWRWSEDVIDFQYGDGDPIRFYSGDNNHD